jgi:hypothetical protein
VRQPSWVKPDGSAIDLLVELRCEEYVMAKNGPKFTGFESDDRNHCMRANGYIRPWEVGK